MHPVDHLRERVDKALAASHLHAARIDDDAWAFAHGDSRGLFLLGNHDESVDDAVAAVRVPVMRAPADRMDAFGRRLLALNLELVGLVAFGIDEDGLTHVVGGRLLAEVDDAALAGIAMTAAGAADAFRGKLLEEFGAEHALE